MRRTMALFISHWQKLQSFWEIRNEESKKLTNDGNYGYQFQGIQWLSQKPRIIEKSLFIAKC